MIMKYTLLLTLVLLIAGTACNNPKKSSAANSGDPGKLDGNWVLNYISGPRIAFDGLYPERKPELSFSVADMRVSGNTGCNSFSGPLKVDGNKISFSEPMAITKMMCPGSGETVFLETLKKISSYSVSGDTTLIFIMGDIAMMRFSKK